MLNLRQILDLLDSVGHKADMNIFIVGGLPRDRLLGKIKDIADIDVCSSQPLSVVAKEFSIQLAKTTPNIAKTALDGHVSVFTSGSLKIDFSSNFINPGVEQFLSTKNIKNTPWTREVFSRDFFLNTLLMSLDFKKIKDITGEAVKDLDNKIIRTCLTPELTFKYNVNRIIRTIYLACKLDFTIQPDIITWIKKNPQYISQCTQEYLTKNINKSLKFDADKTAYLIEQMDLWDYLPITKALVPYYQKRFTENFHGK